MNRMIKRYSKITACEVWAVFLNHMLIFFAMDFVVVVIFAMDI